MLTASVTDAIVDVSARLVVPRFRTLKVDQIEQKHPGDLVTVADKEAEAELTEIFRAGDPDALVLGEEAVFADPSLLDGLPTAEHAWVIDPVDGTNNFARGSADFGVMVVECRRGDPVRSWIWQPIHDRMFIAEAGGGVTLNGEALAPLPEPGRPLRAAAPKSLRHNDLSGFLLRPTARSCAIDYPHVALGELDVLCYRSQNPWDHLPGALLVSELGGRAALHGGDAYRAGRHGVLLLVAGSPDAWQAADDALVTPDWLNGHPRRA